MMLMNDRNVFVEIEAVQVSIHCEIIKNLLARHRSLSIVKTATFSFAIKKLTLLQGSYYSARNRTDLVLKYLSQISGCYDEFCRQLPYILQSMDLLVKAGVCDVHETELISKEPVDACTEDYGAFTIAAIEESKRYTDRQFWKEVLSIV